MCVCVCVINKHEALSSRQYRLLEKRRSFSFLFIPQITSISHFVTTCVRAYVRVHVFLCLRQEEPHLSVSSSPFMDNGMNPMPPVSMLSKLYGGCAICVDRLDLWFLLFAVGQTISDIKRSVSAGLRPTG